jgi:hypothetical protein
MKTMKLAASVLAMALLVSGCMAGQMSGMTPGMMSGHIYTHTWQPLTVDMNRTEVGSVNGAGDIKHLALCMASVAWDSAAIGDIARKQGMKELYFADLETFSVLRIWNQYTVHVYGK